MKKTITILLILIIGIAIGFVASRYSKSKLLTGKTDDSNCEAKLEKAKTAITSFAETKFVFGKIKEIKDNSIIIESANANPLEDTLTVKTIMVKSETKFMKSEAKDNAVFQKEMEEYQKTTAAQANGTQISTPPMPFAEKEISLSDLKAGDQITAEASENVKDKTSFEATKITLQIMPVIPNATLNPEVPSNVSATSGSASVPPTNIPTTPLTVPSSAK